MEQQALVNRYFASTAPYWEEIYQRETVYSIIYRERLQAALRLVDRLGLERGSSALEIGCGPGFGTLALAERGFFVHAIDVVPEMVQGTLKRALGAGVGSPVKGSVSDIQALSFAKGAFDLVLVVGVTEWLASLDKPLAEIARVLKPGGYVVAAADNAWALHCVLDPAQNPSVVPMKRVLGSIVRRIRRSDAKLRTRSYSTRQLNSALRGAGFKKIDGITVGFGPFSFFNRKLIPEAVGVRVHRRLQKLAERGVFAIRSAGLTQRCRRRKT